MSRPASPYHISPKSSLRNQVNEDLPHSSPTRTGSPRQIQRDLFRPHPMWSMSTMVDKETSAVRASPRSSFANPSASPSSRHIIPGDASSSGSGSSGAASSTAKGSPQTFNMSAPGPRRPSRFDPMDPNGDEDEGGYEDLGSRHPLRRVAEEGTEEGISLPSIKSLFGTGGDGPGTPGAPNTHHASHTPTLPPLVPPSPSSSTSPSISYRTARYPSSGSSFSTISENGLGWWAPEFERGSTSMPNIAAPHPRAHSFPYAPTQSDDRDNKRRRSDQPVSSGDSEEAARLRWQAQTRNASFPNSMGSISGPSGSALLRNNMPPPPSVSPLPRGSVSHSLHTPTDERPVLVPRSASIVGGQLARSFADLTAADRASASRSPSMGPPVLPHPTAERRPSLFPPAPHSQPMSAHAQSLPLPMEDIRSSLPPILPHSSSFTGLLHPDHSPTDLTSRRQSVTRPPSPDRPSGVRRSSLTEIIKAKTGDGVAMASGRSPGSIEIVTGGDTEMMTSSIPRRASVDSVRSTGAGRYVSAPSGSRSRKREEPPPDPAPQNEAGQSSYGAMDVLAEGATRVAEAEAEADAEGEPDGNDNDGEPSHAKGEAGGPKYSCSYCLKTFSRPSSLRIHTYSHTGERPFVCPEPSCRRRFSVQSNLKRHSKVHLFPLASSSSGASGSNTSSQPATSRPATAQPAAVQPELFNSLLGQTPYSSPLPPGTSHTTGTSSPHLTPLHPQTATGSSSSPMRPLFSGGPSEQSQGRLIHPPPAPSHDYPPHQGGYPAYGYGPSPPPHSNPYQQHPHPHHLPDDQHHYLPHIPPEQSYYQQSPLHQQYTHPPPQAYDHHPHHPYTPYPPPQHQYQQYPVVHSERYMQPSPGPVSHPPPSFGVHDHQEQGGEGDDGEDAEGDEVEEDM